MSKRKTTIAQTLSSFWRFTRPDKWFFVAGTVMAGIAVVVNEILPPYIIAQAFNKIQALQTSGAPLTLPSLMGYVWAYIGFVLLAIVLWRAQVVFVWVYEIRSMKRIMDYLFNHLQQQDSTFHENRFGGALVSQVNKFVGAYERIADEFTWSITTGVVAFIASLVVLFVAAPWYAFTLLVVSVIYMAIVLWRMKRQFPYDRRLASSESQRTAKLADMITNVSTVRAFAGEKHENQLFGKQTTETNLFYKQLLTKHLVNDTISHTGTAFISILAFVAGVVAITEFSAPAGTLFLAVTYTVALSRRLWEFSRVMRNLNRAFGDAYDMTEIMRIKPAVKDPINPDRANIKHGQISFRDVGFRYKEGQAEHDTLFRHLSLDIAPGEKVGLVGPSGGGKTTITKLILRFMDIQEGEILIDGQNIADIAQQDLRSHIAYVSQEPLLFHRSLEENIRYGKLDATDEEVRKAAKMAHADEFVKRMPEGYQTLVGERGVKLSGGQRQRVAIARAMIKDAPILILDEATSALDSESERLIQDALWKLMEGRTAIAIAHRLSTIQKMDRIVVLDQGKIVEQGSHKELIKQKGLYAELWNHQSGGFLED